MKAGESMAKRHAVYNSSDSEHESSENEEDEKLSPEDGGNKKLGLANVMAKILNKDIPQYKQVVLYKSQTDRQIRKRKSEAKKSDGSDSEEDAETKRSKEADEEGERISKIEKKKLWEEMGRVKPTLMEREKERNLQKIAQRGVVQLFNAVRKQQKLVEEKVSEAGSSERKKEKVLGTMTKGKFLDILKGTENMDQCDMGEKSDKKVKTDREEKKWDILREDFMMGAKMKDWDKESSDEGVSLTSGKQTELLDSDSE